MNISERLPFFVKHVQDDLLPFWQKACDHDYGGVFTCFSNDGSQLVSKDKYVWSQGRFVWVWSRICSLIERGLLTGDMAAYRRQLDKTIRFISDYVFLANGNCAFLLSESGEKKEPRPGEGYDTSFFADCFVLLGFTEYSRVFHDGGLFAKTLSLFDRVRTRLREGAVKSEPYPVPVGYRSYAFPMIMLNVTQEMAEVAKILQHQREGELRTASLTYMKDLMETFCQEDGRVAEMLPDDESEQDTLLARHVNPGHAIESMWFVFTSAKRAGREDYVQKAVDVIKRSFELGWDRQCGGLLRFVDRAGGMPRGTYSGSAYETLVLDTWDTKLWWPHSEALYATLFAYTLTGDEEMRHLYEQVERYVFATFPNPNREIGEWIQIRNRQGEPISKVVALPVKDPYHIMRNLLLLIELLATDCSTEVMPGNQTGGD